MRNLLLASAAVAALAAFSSPAFALTEAEAKAAVSGAPAATADNITKPVVSAEIDNMRDQIKVGYTAPTGYGLPISNNVAYVEQVGNNNTNSQDQTGKLNLSVVNQQNNHNNVRVTQDTTGYEGTRGNVSVVNQTASVSFDGNSAEISQTGVDNTAVLTQTGFQNGWDRNGNGVSFATKQIQVGNNNLAVAKANGVAHLSVQDQGGSNHVSTVHQTGYNSRVLEDTPNLADVKQRDTGQQSYISQDGLSHYAKVDQSGTGNTSVQLQFGSHNGSFSFGHPGSHLGAYVTQTGEYNTAAQLQTGSGDRAVITQSGTGNVAAQVQTGDVEWAEATQSGSNNLLTQVQTGVFNQAYATQSGTGNIGVQIQTGMQGKLYLTQELGSNNRSTQVQGVSLNYANATQSGTGNRSTQTQN